MSKHIFPLSLSSETFNAFKTDFDMLLRQLLVTMESQESEEAKITMTMDIKLQKGQARDFLANGYDGTRDVMMPTFKHKIQTVLQAKNSKSGNLGGNMELVWDNRINQYVMMPIDNGQTSLFDDDGDPKAEETAGANAGDPTELPAAEPLGLPAAENADDGDYVCVDEAEGEVIDQPVDGENTVSGRRTGEREDVFDKVRRLAGMEAVILEANGTYSVRCKEDGAILLSSGLPVSDRAYISEEVLKPHVGHTACILIGSEKDTIPTVMEIACYDCMKTLAEIEENEVEIVDGGSALEDDYPYEDPADAE